MVETNSWTSEPGFDRITVFELGQRSFLAMRDPFLTVVRTGP
jgi:hypothetical protein